MSTIARMALLGLLTIAAPGGTGARRVEAFRAEIFRGACYCRTAGALRCTGGLSEAECRKRCDEALCDEWFWKERLPCWNWGYGG